MADLAQKRCIPCRKDAVALTDDEVQAQLKHLQNWQLNDQGKSLYKTYKLKNFSDALAFVNTIGRIAESENHHPDIALGWGYVNITLQTHSIGGLHENDFIIAAKIDSIQ
jgi:4a-hydroxytetrahydrobiopterin dehydratase